MKLQNNAQHNTTIRKPFYEFYVPWKIMQHGPAFVASNSMPENELTFPSLYQYKAEYGLSILLYLELLVQILDLLEFCLNTIFNDR